MELTPFDGHRIVHQEGVQDVQTAYPKPPYSAQLREQMDRWNALPDTIVVDAHAHVWTRNWLRIFGRNAPGRNFS